MIVQVVFLEPREDLADDFISEAKANVQASLLEPGVLQFDLLQETDKPIHFVLYEVYRSTKDMEEHRKTAHFERWSKVALPMLARERTRIIYEKLAP